MSGFTGAEIAEIVGYLVGSWVFGFCGAYLIAVFKRGLENI